MNDAETGAHPCVPATWGTHPEKGWRAFRGVLQPLGSALPTDINECVTALHTCSRGEHCVNTIGSFRCFKALTCEPGYSLQDGECTGKDRREALPTSPCPIFSLPTHGSAYIWPPSTCKARPIAPTTLCPALTSLLGERPSMSLFIHGLPHPIPCPTWTYPFLQRLWAEYSANTAWW